MRRHPRLSVLTPLVLASLVLAGCGGGSSGADDRAAYVQAAEQICAQGNDEVEALPRPTSVASVGPFTDQVLAALTRTAEDVAALTPPEADRAELTEKVLDPLQRDVVEAEGYAEQVRAAVEANDSAGLLALLQEVPTTSADVAFMRDYGLVECANAADTAD